MKYYIYYATEENCFETEKIVSENPIENVKEILKDDYISEKKIGEIAGKMSVDYSKAGFAIYETEQGQGYNIIIGVARHGKCSEISKRIAELRREAIAMCY